MNGGERKEGSERARKKMLESRDGEKGNRKMSEIEE